VGWTVGFLLLAMTPAAPKPAWVFGSSPENSQDRFDDASPRAGDGALFDPSSFEVRSDQAFQEAVAGSDARTLPSRWNPVVRHATEPGALVLLGTGLLGIATLLRKRQRPH
jgi:hypothetical protein